MAFKTEVQDYFEISKKLIPANTCELKHILIMILQNSTVPRFPMSTEDDKLWITQKTAVWHLHESPRTVSDANGAHFLGQRKYYMCKCNKVLLFFFFWGKSVLSIERLPMKQQYIEKAAPGSSILLQNNHGISLRLWKIFFISYKKFGIYLSKFQWL